MTRLVVTPRADADIKAILDWIAVRNMPAAIRLAHDLERRLLSLTDFPLSGRAETIGRFDGRVLVHGPYLIFYTASPDEVRIVRVVDGRRDLNTLF